MLKYNTCLLNSRIKNGLKSTWKNAIKTTCKARMREQTVCKDMYVKYWRCEYGEQLRDAELVVVACGEERRQKQCKNARRRREDVHDGHLTHAQWLLVGDVAEEKLKKENVSEAEACWFILLS